MTLPSVTVIAFGASVKGPQHKRLKFPNQDAWCKFRNRSGTMLVVCDGLGSAPLSHIGADMACSSAKETYSSISKKNLLEPKLFIKKLVDSWSSKIPQGDFRKYATTCAILVISKAHQSFWASLGDGMIIAKENGKSAIKITQDRELFGNLTIALGVEKNIDEWQLGFLENITPGFCALLATDGVADDLDPHKYSELLKYLYDKYQNMNPNLRWRSLANELNHWNTPGHLDDKTLTFLWVEK